MNWITGISTALGTGGIAFHLWGTFCVFHYLRNPRKRGARAAASAEGITVLKPLKGIDRDLRANLETFFQQDYPSFELIFCVADPRDPAVDLVKELILANPGVLASLSVGEQLVGPNPKIRNLQGGYERALYEMILISDSNIRVDQHYLSDMALQMEGHDLISSVVVGRGAESFAGSVEEIFLGSFYSRPMLLTHYIGTPCVMGKSMLFRRAAMRAIGGLRVLAPYLAEDFMAGELFRRAGFRVGISRYTVTQQVASPTFRSFWSRHRRWGLIRKTHAFPIFLIEPFFTNALVACSSAAFALHRIAETPFLPVAAVLLSLWLALDMNTLRLTGSSVSWRSPFYWFAREMLHLPLWAHILSGNQVQWKDGTWHLARNGVLTSSVALNQKPFPDYSLSLETLVGESSSKEIAQLLTPQSR